MEKMEIYKKLKHLRKERGLTLNTMAEKIGSDYQQISRIERGKSKLSIDLLMRMANALETPITDIVHQKQEPQKIVSFPQKEEAPFAFEELLTIILEKPESFNHSHPSNDLSIVSSLISQDPRGFLLSIVMAHTDLPGPQRGLLSIVTAHTDLPDPSGVSYR